MKDHEYHALTDAFFQYVEDTLDEGYPDIDCERNGGVLTLSFENKTKVSTTDSATSSRRC